MLTKGKKASGEEPDDPSQDSVYDFLYCDTRRIGSFLAQFDVSGHLQQVTASDSISKGHKGGIQIWRWWWRYAGGHRRFWGG